MATIYLKKQFCSCIHKCQIMALYSRKWNWGIRHSDANSRNVNISILLHLMFTTRKILYLLSSLLNCLKCWAFISIRLENLGIRPWAVTLFAHPFHCSCGEHVLSLQAKSFFRSCWLCLQWWGNCPDQERKCSE